jgi:hypothetical protein
LGGGFEAPADDSLFVDIYFIIEKKNVQIFYILNT